MAILKEITVENAAIEWLQKLGYTYTPGKELSREPKKAEVKEELFRFLKETYAHVPESVIEEATSIFLTQSEMDVANRNREFHLKLTKGISLSWKDKDDKEFAEHFYPIRSEERRVGKECRSRWSQYDENE